MYQFNCIVFFAFVISLYLILTDGLINFFYMEPQNPLDCLRCNSTLKYPVRLPCQHHFCRDCIQSDKCYKCDRGLILSELNEDKVLSYVIESSNEATETCANCDKISQPMYFCETCQQPLCNECRETTHKAKIFYLHHIVQLEERGRVRNRPFCSAHNEPFILFCLDSKSLMCIECFNSTSMERRGHFVNIDVAHKICCNKLEKSASNLRTFQHELKEQIELRRRLIVELEKNSKQLNTDIEQKCAEIIDLVNSLKTKLIKKISNEKRKKEMQINTQLRQFLNLESPISVNLLSISIFCSYASKIDVLHCFADLYKSSQNFLTSYGQLMQKVKFDCALFIDFPDEFNKMISKPMGFMPNNSTVGNVFLDCNPTTLVTTKRHHSIDSVKNHTLDKNPSLTVAIQKVPPNNFEPIDIEDPTETTIPTFGAMIEAIQIQYNPLQIHQMESEKIGDQRFMEQYQQITNPLQKSAQEISIISKGLMDLQKDITLRRCVVNGDELMNRISFCEDAWDRLDAHSKQVQRILNHYMGQFWRKEIERVQRQQNAVKEKVEEMKQLQKLAQRALQVSQQLKPFATQMANLISVIDVRRGCTVTLSPMEQICLEITQIEPNSAGRVAAIEKEEELRRLAKLEAEKTTFDQKEAVKMRQKLKEVKSATPKQQRTSLILEMDRDRAQLSINGNSNNTSNSCLSSPMTIKKRQQLQSRVHRNSESAILETSFASSSTKFLISGELTVSLEETEQPSFAAISPLNSTIKQMPKNIEKSICLRQGEINVETVRIKLDKQELDNSQSPINNQATVNSTSTIGANIIRSQAQNRDPSILLVREKLLESIREKVKKFDP